MKNPVDKEITLIAWLAEHFANASKTSLKKKILHGSASVNGKMETNPARLLSPGDQVAYEKKTAPRDKLPAPYRVLFEDDDLLVAVKPAGLLSIGDRGTGGTSFYQQLLEWVKEKSKGRERLYVVHRLDREVSGLLLFAKSEKIQEQVKSEWTKARKLYYALVEGAPKKEKGTLRSWLMEGHEQKVFSVKEQEGAKLAVTHYRVMDRTSDYTLLEVELETGRKNQIRVHLADMGCPVVGDRRYGADATYSRRIRLHAYYLSLPHPSTGRLLEFKSPMPQGFLVLKPGDEKYK